MRYGTAYSGRQSISGWPGRGGGRLQACSTKWPASLCVERLGPGTGSTRRRSKIARAGCESRCAGSWWGTPYAPSAVVTESYGGIGGGDAQVRFLVTCQLSLVICHRPSASLGGEAIHVQRCAGWVRMFGAIGELDHRWSEGAQVRVRSWSRKNEPSGPTTNEDAQVRRACLGRLVRRITVRRRCAGSVRILWGQSPAARVEAVVFGCQIAWPR